MIMWDLKIQKRIQIPKVRKYFIKINIPSCFIDFFCMSISVDLIHCFSFIYLIQNDIKFVSVKSYYILLYAVSKNSHKNHLKFCNIFFIIFFPCCCWQFTQMVSHNSRMTRLPNGMCIIIHCYRLTMHFWWLNSYMTLCCFEAGPFFSFLNWVLRPFKGYFTSIEGIMHQSRTKEGIYLPKNYTFLKNSMPCTHVPHMGTQIQSKWQAAYRLSELMTSRLWCRRIFTIFPKKLSI